MILTLGSAKSDDIVISDNGILANHIEIQIINSETLLLSDKTDTFNMKVNGNIAVQGRITRSHNFCLVQYCPDIDVFFDTVLDIYKKKKVDFTAEFKDLMLNFSKYQRKKDQILKTPLAPLIARVLITAGTMAIVFYSNDDPNRRILLMSASGVIAMLLGSFFSPSPAKRNANLDLLLLDYEHLLVCPKCNVKMIHQSYTYWQGKKKCNNEKCNAIYQL